MKDNKMLREMVDTCIDLMLALERLIFSGRYGPISTSAIVGFAFPHPKERGFMMTVPITSVQRASEKMMLFHVMLDILDLDLHDLTFIVDGDSNVPYVVFEMEDGMALGTIIGDEMIIVSPSELHATLLSSLLGHKPPATLRPSAKYWSPIYIDAVKDGDPHDTFEVFLGDAYIRTEFGKEVKLLGNAVIEVRDKDYVSLFKRFTEAIAGPSRYRVIIT